MYIVWRLSAAKPFPGMALRSIQTNQQTHRGQLFKRKKVVGKQTESAESSAVPSNRCEMPTSLPRCPLGGLILRMRVLLVTTSNLGGLAGFPPAPAPSARIKSPLSTESQCQETFSTVEPGFITRASRRAIVLFLVPREHVSAALNPTVSVDYRQPLVGMRSFQRWEERDHRLRVSLRPGAARKLSCQ
jgi:hypothetical protein